MSFLVLFLFFGCTAAISESDLAELNGYWEIAEVKFPDGNTKTYTANTTIDFIQLDDREGYRKKVQPQLDGTFETSKDIEMFKLIEKDGFFLFSYKNTLSQREEKLVRLKANSFSVVNSDTMIYTYRRHEPLNVLK